MSTLNTPSINYLIMNRSSWTSQIINLINFHIQRLTDIMKNEIEIRLSVSSKTTTYTFPIRCLMFSLDPVRRLSTQMTSCPYKITKYVKRMYHLQQTFAEMTTDKSSTSTYHDSLLPRHDFVLYTRSWSHTHS